MKANIGKRILVVGDSNAGKSTLAARLAADLDLPFVEIDALFWLPNWQTRSGDEFQRLLSENLPTDGSWSAAGNYFKEQVPWLRADTIVWLDYPLRVTLPRLVKRTWRRWRREEVLWGTNQERITNQLMVWDPSRSLINWTIRNHRRRIRTYEAAMRGPLFGQARWFRLGSPAETAAWFEGVSEAVARISL